MESPDPAAVARRQTPLRDERECIHRPGPSKWVWTRNPRTQRPEPRPDTEAAPKRYGLQFWVCRNGCPITVRWRWQSHLTLASANQGIRYGALSLYISAMPPCHWL